MTDLDEVLASGLAQMADDASHDHALADTIRQRSRYRRAVTIAPIAATVTVIGLLSTMLVLRSASTNATHQSTSACDGSVVTSVIPIWARAGFSDKEPTMPYATSSGGHMVALLFNNPLTSPTTPGTGNKILWVTDTDDGAPLTITGRLEGGTQTMHQELSSPGPSGVDAPAAGCWQFTLDWGSNHETINIPFSPPPTVPAPAPISEQTNTAKLPGVHWVLTSVSRQGTVADTTRFGEVALELTSKYLTLDSPLGSELHSYTRTATTIRVGPAVGAMAHDDGGSSVGRVGPGPSALGTAFKPATDLAYDLKGDRLSISTGNLMLTFRNAGQPPRPCFWSEMC